MKRSYYVGLLLILFAIPFSSIAEVTIPVDPPTTENPDPDPDGRNYGKHRMAPAPILCFIDVEAGTVTFSSSALDEIDSYQIYDESRETCLGIYDTLEEFMAALTNLSGSYTLKFLTPQGTFTAHINL